MPVAVQVQTSENTALHLNRETIRLQKFRRTPRTGGVLALRQETDLRSTEGTNTSRKYSPVYPILPSVGTLPATLVLVLPASEGGSKSPVYAKKPGGRREKRLELFEFAFGRVGRYAQSIRTGAARYTRLFRLLLSRASSLRSCFAPLTPAPHSEGVSLSPVRNDRRRQALERHLLLPGNHKNNRKRFTKSLDKMKRLCYTTVSE